MRLIMKKIRNIFRLLRLCLILPGIDWRDSVFRKDLARWKAIMHIETSDILALAEILSNKPEFRNLLIFRNNHRPIFRRWIAFCYHPLKTLYIETLEIGLHQLINYELLIMLLLNLVLCGYKNAYGMLV